MLVWIVGNILWKPVPTDGTSVVLALVALVQVHNGGTCRMFVMF